MNCDSNLDLKRREVEPKEVRTQRLHVLSDRKLTAVSPLKRFLASLFDRDRFEKFDGEPFD